MDAENQVEIVLGQVFVEQVDGEENQRSCHWKQVGVLLSEGFCISSQILPLDLVALKLFSLLNFSCQKTPNIDAAEGIDQELNPPGSTHSGRNHVHGDNEQQAEYYSMLVYHGSHQGSFLLTCSGFKKMSDGLIGTFFFFFNFRYAINLILF